MTEVTEIRTMTGPDIDVLLDWARQEGWNPGLADRQAFQVADPEGFIGCYIDNVMVAGISAVRYGRDFGFIGLYITHPDFRGRGLGRRVWDAAMQHLQNRVIGLDGVPEQQENYRSMGFEPAYQTFRWSGRLAAREEMKVDGGSADTDLFSALERFDHCFFPGPRTNFLAQWRLPPRDIRVARHNGDIIGYAVRRACHEGEKIGPLFAADTDGAMSLLHDLASDREALDIHLDVPAFQMEFSWRLEKAGFTRSFATMRMYRGTPSPVRHQGIFATTTLELG